MFLNQKVFLVSGKAKLTQWPAESVHVAVVAVVSVVEFLEVQAEVVDVQ